MVLGLIRRYVEPLFFFKHIVTIKGKRDFLRTVTPALLTDGLRIEGGI
jgi:hypothetical protein